MSASLVGSEMCIRDRLPCCLRPLARAVSTGPGEKESRAGAGAREAGKPVSYTHLTLPTICSV
eukprot:14141220-Alexandrium_andersonii.AAC.1